MDEDRKLSAASFMQTGPDNRAWIELDHISPKLLRELQRQYDPSPKDGPRHPLAKSAAKVKAWARQSKLGIDIRLRRKINAEHDEVTDIHLVPEPFVGQNERLKSIAKQDLQNVDLPWMAELPAQNEISELPDSSVTQELSTISQREPENNPERSYSGDTITEPLPRYVPRQEVGPGPLTTEAASVSAPLPQSETPHGRSSSQSSIVPTPKRGLSVHLSVEPKDGDSSAIQGDWDAPGGDFQPFGQQETQRMHSLRFDLAEANRRLEQEQKNRERFEGLLRDVRRELSKQRRGEDSPVDNRSLLRGLKVAESARYETETDVEPPSPSEQRITSAVRSKKPLTNLKKKKSVPKPRAPGVPRATKPDHLVKSGPGLSSLVERQPTVPKRTPASAGVEALWAALLKAQANIIGPEHPLTYQAKSDLARSRAAKHQSSSKGTLTALWDTRVLATQILGDVHPLVAAFSTDLETLNRLTDLSHDGLHDGAAVQGDSISSPVQETSLQMSEPLVPPKSTPMAQHPPAESGRVTLPGSPVAETPQSGEGSAKPSLPRITTTLYISETPNGMHPQSTDALYNAWHPPHKPQNGLLVLGGSVVDGIANASIGGIMWLQAKYGSVPPVEQGKVRVRWTCSCGQQLHDDFVERRQGAARELEAYLNRPRTHTGGTSVSPSSSEGSRTFTNTSSIGGPPSSQTSWSSYGYTGQVPPGGSSLSDTKQHGSYGSAFFSPPPEPPWLLTCANEDREAPKLAHLDMHPQKIRWDKDLALSLRDHYFNINKRWYRTLRLRGLQTIEFVQFEVHQNRFCDIRKRPDLPPSTIGDYSFEPGELIPPVGSQYLLHLFKHPEDYDGELITYLRAPMRNGRLQLGVGWGINLVENFEAPKVWLMVSLFFTLASLVFGISWAAKRHDVQGAFGVAAWITTLAALSVGWLQAILG